MPIRHEPTTSTLRFYGRASDDPTPQYDAVCTVVWETPRTVWIRGLHGTLTRRLLRELLAWLVDNHILLVKAHRDSARVLPLGVVQVDGHTEIDVAKLAARVTRR